MVELVKTNPREILSEEKKLWMKPGRATINVASKLGGEDDDIMNPLLGVLTS